MGGIATEVDLNSPWDLTLFDGRLYIAMAGFHQLWEMDLASGEVYPIAGTGREGLLDGPVEYVWLAQPSGITTDGLTLYFADSESSAIRMMGLSVKRPPRYHCRERPVRVRGRGWSG